MKNKYAAHIKDMVDSAFRLGKQMGAQAMYDAYSIALNDTEHFGERRLSQMAPVVEENYTEICDIYENDAPDRDYRIARVDRRMKEIFPATFKPYLERYDFAKVMKI